MNSVHVYIPADGTFLGLARTKCASHAIKIAAPKSLHHLLQNAHIITVHQARVLVGENFGQAGPVWEGSFIKSSLQQGHILTPGLVHPTMPPVVSWRASDRVTPSAWPSASREASL